MERRVRSGHQEIVFTLKRSRRRRTVALRVEPSGAVTVFAPYSSWAFFIDRFVRRHSAWILKKLVYFEKHLAQYPPRPQIPETLRDTYKETLERRLPAVVGRYAEALEVKPRSVKVANQRSRWGSCSARGDLRFSWRIAELPEAVFDYIVIHELAHLKEMNHSPRFWTLVHSLVPDYKTHRIWLRKEGPG